MSETVGVFARRLNFPPEMEFEPISPGLALVVCRLGRHHGPDVPGNGGLHEPGGNPQLWSKTVDRAQKEQVVDELGQIFASSGVVVVAHYTGMTVAQMQTLRAKMREVNGSVRVAKNKLAMIALEGKPGHKMG